MLPILLAALFGKTVNIQFSFLTLLNNFSHTTHRGMCFPTLWWLPYARYWFKSDRGLSASTGIPDVTILSYSVIGGKPFLAQKCCSMLTRFCGGILWDTAHSPRYVV